MKLEQAFLNQRIALLASTNFEQIEIQELLFDIGFWWQDGKKNRNASTMVNGRGVVIGLTGRINGYIDDTDLKESKDLARFSISELKESLPKLKELFTKKFGNITIEDAPTHQKLPKPAKSPVASGQGWIAENLDLFLYP